MATAFEVTGPHTIQMKAAGGSYATVGRGDNDDLFRIESEYQYVDIFTNEFGTMPAEVIRTGAKATVSFSLVLIDRTNFETVIAAIDGGQTSGTYAYPKVGSVLKPGITGDTTFSVKLLPDSTAAGQKTVEVFRCRLLGLNHTDFGNKANRIVIRAEALPDADAADSTVYTIT
jgi:hypothetical protein